MFDLTCIYGLVYKRISLVCSLVKLMIANIVNSYFFNLFPVLIWFRSYRHIWCDQKMGFSFLVRRGVDRIAFLSWKERGYSYVLCVCVCVCVCAIYLKSLYTLLRRKLDSRLYLRVGLYYAGSDQKSKIMLCYNMWLCIFVYVLGDYGALHSLLSCFVVCRVKL